MKGSCACGGIQYELSDKIFIVNNCHCSICRKVHGAAFATYGHSKAENFRWLQGEDLITSYQSTPHNFRNFCRVCGSNVPIVVAQRNQVAIPMGTLDDAPGIQPEVNLFVAYKAPWFEITDSLPNYSEMPEPEVIAARKCEVIN
jgi:hypothetical protein